MCEDYLPKQKKRQKSLRLTISEHCVLTTVVQKESDSSKNSFLHPFSTCSNAQWNEQKTHFQRQNWLNEHHPGSQPSKICIPEGVGTVNIDKYLSNIDGLDDYLHQFSRTSDRKIQTEQQSRTSTVKDVFLRMIPANTASSERRFSTSKLMKTYLRSTMNDDGLYNVISKKGKQAVVAWRDFNSLMMALADALLVFCFPSDGTALIFLFFISLNSSCEWDFKNVKQTRRRSICFL